MTRYFWLVEGCWYLTDEGTLTGNQTEAQVFTDDTYRMFINWVYDLNGYQRKYLPEDQQNKRNGHPALFKIDKEQRKD